MRQNDIDTDSIQTSTGKYRPIPLNNPTNNKKRPPGRTAFSVSTGVRLFLVPVPFQVGEVILGLLRHDLNVM